MFEFSPYYFIGLLISLVWVDTFFFDSTTIDSFFKSFANLVSDQSKTLDKTNLDPNLKSPPKFNFSKDLSEKINSFIVSPKAPFAENLYADTSSKKISERDVEESFFKYLFNEEKLNGLSILANDSEDAPLKRHFLDVSETVKKSIKHQKNSINLMKNNNHSTFWITQPLGLSRAMAFSAPKEDLILNSVTKKVSDNYLDKNKIVDDYYQEINNISPNSSLSVFERCFGKSDSHLKKGLEDVFKPKEDSTNLRLDVSDIEKDLADHFLFINKAKVVSDHLEIIRRSILLNLLQAKKKDSLLNSRYSSELDPLFNGFLSSLPSKIKELTNLYIENLKLISANNYVDVAKVKRDLQKTVDAIIGSNQDVKNLENSEENKSVSEKRVSSNEINYERAFIVINLALQRINCYSHSAESELERELAPKDLSKGKEIFKLLQESVANIFTNLEYPYLQSYHNNLVLLKDPLAKNNYCKEVENPFFSNLQERTIDLIHKIRSPGFFKEIAETYSSPLVFLEDLELTLPPFDNLLILNVIANKLFEKRMNNLEILNLFYESANDSFVYFSLEKNKQLKELSKDLSEFVESITEVTKNYDIKNLRLNLQKLNNWITITDDLNLKNSYGIIQEQGDLNYLVSLNVIFENLEESLKDLDLSSEVFIDLRKKYGFLKSQIFSSLKNIQLILKDPVYGLKLKIVALNKIFNKLLSPAEENLNDQVFQSVNSSFISNYSLSLVQNTISKEKIQKLPLLLDNIFFLKELASKQDDKQSLVNLFYNKQRQKLTPEEQLLFESCFKDESFISDLEFLTSEAFVEAYLQKSKSISKDLQIDVSKINTVKDVKKVLKVFLDQKIVNKSLPILANIKVSINNLFKKKLSSRGIFKAKDAFEAPGEDRKALKEFYVCLNKVNSKQSVNISLHSISALDLVLKNLLIEDLLNKKEPLSSKDLYETSDDFKIVAFKKEAHRSVSELLSLRFIREQLTRLDTFKEQIKNGYDSRNNLTKEMLEPIRSYLDKKGNSPHDSFVDHLKVFYGFTREIPEVDFSDSPGLSLLLQKYPLEINEDMSYDALENGNALWSYLIESKNLDPLVFKHLLKG